MKFHVLAVGLSGPGSPDWRRPVALLRGEAGGSSVPDQAGSRSPASGVEQRRATAITQLALEVAMEAAGPDRNRWDFPTVFASSDGEVNPCNAIFDQLAGSPRMVSPTQFHNSVRNAASGYWGIASRSHQAATHLYCFDETCTAGPLESAALITDDGPPPYPIRPFRPLLAPFAIAARENAVVYIDCAGPSLLWIEVSPCF